MSDVVSDIGLVVAAVALVVAIAALLPQALQWRIDRNPKRYYSFSGPENGWLDAGDLGHPQINLTIRNRRSVAVELGVQAVESVSEFGLGGIHLACQRIALGHSGGASIASKSVEISAHGVRHLFITGVTPSPGYRGVLGVLVDDGERREFLTYHHRADDALPWPRTAPETTTSP